MTNRECPKCVLHWPNYDFTCGACAEFWGDKPAEHDSQVSPTQNLTKPAPAPRELPINLPLNEYKQLEESGRTAQYIRLSMAFDAVVRERDSLRLMRDTRAEVEQKIERLEKELAKAKRLIADK